MLKLQLIIIGRIRNQITAPNGISANTAGKVINTRPGPSSGEKPRAKTAGNIAIPAKIAIPVSAPII